MIRITDMTISCLTGYSPSRDQLARLIDLLLSTGVDAVEMPAEVYDEVKPDPFNILLRIHSPDDAVRYPEINRFICRSPGVRTDPKVTLEIQRNDVREVNLIHRFDVGANVRLTGLDDIFCHDFRVVFENITNHFSGILEFCPENSFHCATAAAVEWIENGGTHIVASFSGLTGKASLEEVLLALRVVRRNKPGASYAMLPKIADLMEEILSAKYSGRKAIIGNNIFDVESGIHIDGILKKPEMYEPFLPELVGSRRRFIIGKHSGSKSVKLKLAELGLDSAEHDISGLLNAVREESIRRKSGLSEDAFRFLAQRHRK